jgi:hypothetical protein
MDEETAIKLLREVVDMGPLPTDEPETHPLMEAALKAMLELQRFRKRELLVQALLRESVNMVRADYGDHGMYRETLRDAVDAVRDFKLSASAAEGGESA